MASPNQKNMAIVQGQAPRGVKRIDTPKVKFEQPHVTFDDDAALNKDGTWKHGQYEVTKEQRAWLEDNGWIVP